MSIDRLDPFAMCEHGEFRAACIECLGKPQPVRPRAKPKAETLPFVARYDGRCSECDDTWDAGDARIVRLTDGTYAHEPCAEPM